MIGLRRVREDFGAARRRRDELVEEARRYRRGQFGFHYPEDRERPSRLVTDASQAAHRAYHRLRDVGR
eukprot:3793228-Alexandrium_andersonii.AAC.1